MGGAHKQRRAMFALAILLAFVPHAFALDPSLDISQYEHTAWTIREGFFKGNLYSIAQSRDGYLWLGTEFGLFRFDGNRSIPWQPPTGQSLPDSAVTKLLVTSDGTLWIGTYAGLASWKEGKLTRYPELRNKFVAALLQDHEGTVWAGTLAAPSGQLCAIRNGVVQCYGQDGSLGRIVSSLYEDKTGVLWAGAQSALWRWKPGPPRQYSVSGADLNDLNVGNERELLIAMRDGLKEFDDGQIETYSLRGVKSVSVNRLLTDHDGGLWIGTLDQGLIHVHDGRTDVFSKSDGLSGDVIFSLFEDREGDVWVSTNGGLDRFHDLAVPTISIKQGLSTDAAWSILASRDGSVWIGSRDGLNKWNNGQISIIRKAGGQTNDAPQSLFQDSQGRIWAFTGRGLGYVEHGRFVAVNGIDGGKVHFITGDKRGNLWLSEERSLLHLRDGRLIEQIPWSRMGHPESASVLLSDQGPGGGLWLGFWRGGGVSHFRDGQVLASYTPSNGLSAGAVQDLRFDRKGVLWVATQGGLSRLEPGRVITLTSRNGLPCDTVHWTMEADDRSLWLYMACGLVHIAPAELDAWIADPKRKIEMDVLDAADGVRLRSTASSGYGPRVAKSTDGKLWFVTGEGVQFVNPHHIPFNKLPPPVHIEQVIADHKIRWQNLWSETSSSLRLPRLTRDLEMDYAALSLVAPENVSFKYKLEGYDGDWQDAGNRRQVFYNNLSPRKYRFHVIASNNSGVWNDIGASLDFSIAPAYYQTNWFRALCTLAFLALLWALYRLRVRQLHAQEKKFREAIETMPALAFIAQADGYRTFVNHGWAEYTGLTVEQALGSGWQTAVHPVDLNRVIAKWRASLATGEPPEYEVRLRRADGEYRWFLTRALPLRDSRGRIVKWCGTATDIQDRKRAEQLQADLAHISRVSTLGELAASISHELKQPIAAAIANADTSLRWLMRDKPDVGEAREAIKRIVEDGARAADIIDRLRALYTKSPPQHESLDVNEIVREMVVLLRSEANRYAVSIRTNLSFDLITVSADRVQLQQVLMNLMLNGIEAMQETGGVLTVKSQSFLGGQVLISVSDTGVGLPTNDADQIFGAFFTTKAQGSGMGLAISRSIIESHEGHLWATANDGRGATFYFTLKTVVEDVKLRGG